MPDLNSSKNQEETPPPTTTETWQKRSSHGRPSALAVGTTATRWTWRGTRASVRTRAARATCAGWWRSGRRCPSARSSCEGSSTRRRWWACTCPCPPASSRRDPSVSGNIIYLFCLYMSTCWAPHLEMSPKRFTVASIMPSSLRLRSSYMRLWVRMTVALLSAF